MTANDLRSAFLDFFAARGHTVVPSASILVKDDPSLLFINAGMNQFKSVFLGQETRDYNRAASSQKCLRVSGKHNDLENVGVTPRHHTFFEMLGNFSFGDYFKEDAIKFAWDFLTVTLKLDPSRLWATVYTDDDEAEDLWKRIAPELKDRVRRFGESENYWSMGDVGPCGPCSEIHYDFGPEFSCGKPDCTVNCDCDRYLEIWNLVFMQFNRAADGTLTPLPKPSVDTGMGLERLATVVQGKHSNYDSDLFRVIIDALASDSGVPYDKGPDGMPHRVCADHLRALVFTVADGGMPGNEGAGYVLRRILRRAARLGKRLGYDGPFLYRFVDNVVDLMGAAYPELKQRRDHVVHVIENEEARFAETLDAGLARFEEVKQSARNKVIPGEEAFKLYDTFGFPLDLTEVLAREEGMTVDVDGFQNALNEQRKRSRAEAKFRDQTTSVAAGLTYESQFDYSTFELDAELLWVSTDKKALVLDRTPFYTEAGGQIDDKGQITCGDEFDFNVESMEKVDKAIVHHGNVVSGDPSTCIGKTVHASVDIPRRRMIQRNHTATHLLHKALRTVLGDHAQQAGSLVAPDRLRFDFSHTGPMTPEQIDEVERIVNREILANTPVAPYETDFDTAINQGVTALFGEKYSDRVRVIRIGDYSSELCGGTHVQSTGEIGQLRITSETGVAAGVRRIEAVTGEKAYEKARHSDATLRLAAEQLKTSAERVPERVLKLIQERDNLVRELNAITQRQAREGGESFQNAVPIDDESDLRIFYRDFSTIAEAKAWADRLKQTSDYPMSGVFTSSSDDQFVASSNPLALELGLDTGRYYKEHGEDLGLRGGGRKDFAQGKVVHDLDREEFIDNWRKIWESIFTGKPKSPPDS